MKTFKYAATIWKETEGYVSKCPELGVTSCGDSFEEALNILKEAVDLYLENAKELGIIEEITESMTGKEKYTAYLEAVI